MKPIKAVIFDMDGTLLDTEPIFLRSDLAVIASYGGFMSEKEHDQYIGMGSTTFFPMIKERYNIEAPLEEIVALQEKIYLQMALEEAEVFPQILDFVRYLSEQGVPLAIASGSTKHVIKTMTEAKGIAPYFSQMVSSGEVEKGKPEADVFLEAARRLGVEPENCLVLEDSPFGVEGAKRAGMPCIALPPPVVHDPNHYLEKADLLFKKGMLGCSSIDLITWYNNHK